MCGRFDTSGLFWRDIWQQLTSFAPVKSPPVNLEPNEDVRPTTRQVTARLDQDGEFLVEPMRWSLVPFWYKGRVKPGARGAGDGFKLTTFNCRIEPFCGATDPKTGEPYKKPAAFRGPFERRRCIVPCSAWWEWQPPDKIKHRFARADGQPIWFAGLWDTCTTADEGEFRSFTIMTGPSEGHLAEYHDRAPVILDQDDWAVWLDPTKDAKDLLQAVRPARFEVVRAG
jgi:putative SOS response-associated peptidase YedK